MKKLKILLFLLSLFAFKGTTYATNVEEIIIIDNQNIDLQLSQDIVLPTGEINSEIKVLKDIEVTFASKDFNDQNKLTLNLSSDLEINNTYNLLTIIGPDVNIDFDTGVSLEDYEVSKIENNSSDIQGINRIIVKNSKTLELYFNNILQEEEFEFKLLNELKIEKLTSALNNKISLLLTDRIEKLSNYLIMILSVTDNSGNEVIFEEDLYEVTTTQDLKISSTSEEEVIIEDELEEEENSIENVALNSAETPDTGPETTVLIFLTFITTSIIYIRKKIIKA